MNDEYQEPRREGGDDVVFPNQRVWVAPEVRELPRLTDLTLQTGSPIPGFGDPGSGSTVF